jgi:hypothetical protein
MVAAATKNQFACIIYSRVCECKSISGVFPMDLGSRHEINDLSLARRAGSIPRPEINFFTAMLSVYYSSKRIRRSKSQRIKVSSLAIIKFSMTIQVANSLDNWSIKKSSEYPFIFIFTYFQSYEHFYKQTSGLVMSSPLSLILADIYGESRKEKYRTRTRRII